MSSQFHTLAKHTVEYYQSNKFLGCIVCDGELPQDAIGYYGKTLITAGEVRLKRIHRATEANPIDVVKYNLQGRAVSTDQQR